MPDSSPNVPSLWRNPQFMKLWVGQTVSLLGSQVTLLALPLTAALILKASASEMGLLTAVQFAPFLLIGLFAGVWVDRLPRRPILITADLGRCLLLATIPLAALVGVLGLVQLYVVGFLVGILTVFFDIAYQAYLPSLVSRANLVEGNSKLEISNSVAQIVGPGAAGALVQIIQAPFAIALDAASFLVSVFFLWRINVPEPAPRAAQPGQNIWHEIREGLDVIFGNPLLRSIAGCTSTANLFGNIWGAVYILYITRELHFEPGMIGLIYSLGSFGVLLGAALPTRLVARFGLGPTIVGASLLGGLTAWLIPLTSGPTLVSVILLIAAQFTLGLGAVVYNVNQVSLRQTITPHRLQGRMNASMRFLVWGTMPIGSLIGGYLGDHLGLRTTLFIGATGSALAFLWVLLSPVRALRTQPRPIDESVPLAAD